MAADIFLSYCSADREIVWDLAARLRDEGAEAWIDQEGIGAATQWSGEIVRALDESNLFVLLVSEASLASDYCRREVSLAAEQAKPLLPVYLEPAALTPELRLHFAGVQHLELQRLGPQETAREIVQALRRVGGEAAATGTAARKIRHNLPAPETVLLGREEEITAWKALLLTPSTRLLTLTAFGGLGKTRAALELAWRCLRESAAEFPQGVWWVAAEEARTAAELVQAISAALGLAPASETDPRAHLFEYLEARKLLLVLDNLEQVRDAGKLVGDLLRAAPGARVVATSRRALGIGAEQRREVAPLASPPEGRSLRPDEAMAYPAVALFVERATARDETFVLDDEVAEVSELCRRLDGVPLAIELAAARVGSRSPAEILERLSDRFKLLQTKSADQPDRHRALRGAIEWSYDLLSEDSQQLFGQLAVFHGGFLLSQAETVCDGDDVEDLIDELLQQSFLRVLPDLIPKRKRFTMLESLREFAADKLAEDEGQAEALREKHARYFAGLAEKALAKQRTSEEAAALLEFQSDLANAEGAFDWSRTSGPALLTARLGASLGRYYERRGYGRRALERLDIAKNAFERADEAPQSLLAAIHRSQAGAWLDCGDLTRAEDYAQRALTVAEALASPHAIAEALNLLGGVASRHQDFAKAQSLFDEAHSKFSQAGDAAGEAIVLNNLGLLELGKPDADVKKAADWLQNARSLWARLGDKAALAQVTSNLALQTESTGDLPEAERLYREALSLDLEIGNPLGIGLDLLNLGEMALRTRRWQEACRLSIAAERILDDLGSPYREAATNQAESAQRDAGDGAESLGSLRAAAAGLTLKALASWAAPPQVT